jgi:hypothetical protein
MPLSPLAQQLVARGHTVNETESGVFVLDSLDTYDAARLDAVASTMLNRYAIRDSLAARMPQLRDARDQITANPPTLFAGLSNQERVALRNIIRHELELSRLMLSLLEGTD